jgi:IS5 family transposase
MKFVGLTPEDDVPDHSVLSRFRTELTQKDAYEKLMGNINGQLEERWVLLKKGAIVDASITDSPRKPRGKKAYEVIEDRKEETDPAAAEQHPHPKQATLAVKTQSHVDVQGAWIKKAGKLRFGYKKHIATDGQGLVRAVITTPANESDIVHLEDVVKKRGLIKAQGYGQIKVTAARAIVSSLNPTG